MDSISDFYKNRDILITGGIGFMGKVLFEKLLRSCSELNQIFILIRPKNEKNCDERLKDILNTPLFDKLKEQNHCFLNKLTAINGDVTKEGLGVSAEDLKKLNNVSILFHSAATVRFDDTIQTCILTNTVGTLKTLKFAEGLNHLKAFIHVSTSYCHLDRKILDEKIYPAYEDWRSIVTYAENSDIKQLDNFVKRYSQHHHNNYTLSKHLAEAICVEFKDKLPLVFIRPAIVVASSREPLPGWVDNLYGPMSMCIGGSMGLIRSVYGNKNIVQEFTPVDVAAKIMILGAYKKVQEQDRTQINVHQLSRSVIVKDLMLKGIEYVELNPFEKTIWVPNCKLTNCYYNHVIMFILFQLLPAFVLDRILWLTGKKPFLAKLQKKIFQGNMTLYPFLSNEWKFQKDKTLELEHLIPESEKFKFRFMEDMDAKLEEYMRNAVIGAKQFIFNEPSNCSGNGRFKIFIMRIVDTSVRSIFCLWIVYKIFLFCNIFT